jgi:hypothetical protein
MPPDWVYTAALVTERIKTARRWLTSAQEDRKKYAELVGRVPDELDDLKLSRNYVENTKDNGVQFITPGNSHDDLKAHMSESLYAVAEEMIRAIDTLSEFRGTDL